MPGADGIAGSIGPVAHSHRDLELFLSAVLHGRPWENDVSIPPLPWRPVGSDGFGAESLGWSGTQGPLRIGVMREDVARFRCLAAVELVEMQPTWYNDHWNLIVRVPVVSL
jgi:hypothetical protein